MTGNSIYRPLQHGSEIRVLCIEPSLDSRDNLLNYRLSYISLQDSVPAVESTGPWKTQKHNFGQRSQTASELSAALSNDPAQDSQQMYHAAKRRKRRKEKFDEKDACSVFLPYLALSYTWGDPQDTVPIHVEGREVLVRRNLHDALIAIRAEPQTSSFPVWADGVCINQCDTEERNKEVQKMAEVYRKASKVVVWLGYVPSTWNFFGLKPTGDVNKILPRLLMKRCDEGSDGINPDEYTSDEILTLVAILDRPYWTRIWILQELVMADYENTFLFWAGTIRRISDLQHAQIIFDTVFSTWLKSPEISSPLNSGSTSEDGAMRIRHQTPDNVKRSDDMDLEVKKTQVDMQYISRLIAPKFGSDISETLVEIGTKKTFDAEAYIQRQVKADGSLDSVEIERMIQSLNELSLALELRKNDSYRRMRRSEVRMALNELCITVAIVIGAATLNTTKEEVDFTLPMYHSLRGQCTDKRDLVYGLLGLQRPEIVSQINPDYGLSVERVLSDFSAAVIRFRGTNFLCEHGRSLSDASSNLPSWVIDLTKGNAAKPSAMALLEKWPKFSAGGARADDIRFSINNDRLYCQGVLYKVDMKTPQPIYGNRDAIILALERVASCYAPGDGSIRSILNISTQTTSKDPEVTYVADMIQDFWIQHSDFAIEGIRLESLFPDQDDILALDLEATKRLVSEMLPMKLFTTMDGMLGSGAETVRDGDSIAILRGCNLPTILRPSREGFELIGMCYLDGVMFGELFREDPTWEELTIL
jgi:hypothetical protein